MKFQRFFFLKLLLLFPLLLLCIKDVNAIDVVKRSDINIEESLSENVGVYSYPKHIYLAQVHNFNEELNNNPEEWIRLMYYFSITRLNLNDIPYNYLIDRSGNIYEGARGGSGVNPGLEGGEGVVLIGIMDSNQILSPRASSSLSSFVEDLSYKYGIPNGSWEYVDLKIKKKENALSYLTYSLSSSPLKNSISMALGDVQWSSVEHLEYKGSIVSVENSKEVEIGKRLTVKVKIKNENDFTWFGDNAYIYVSTKDSVESPHAINLTWESFSKPTHIISAIKPGETGEVSFELEAKSVPNSYKESFIFMKSQDRVVEGSNFEVEFSIIKGNNKIVQVVSPEFGFVNIRECRWYSCKKVEVANSGQVFVTTDKVDGWYEILFNNGSKGWVYQKYAKEI